MPRAVRPLNARVRLVGFSSPGCAAPWSAARCTAAVPASGQSRNAVPSAAARAPRHSAAAMPAPVAMPPAATTGTVTAAVTSCSSAIVPVAATGSSVRPPRCPPASAPCAARASAPASAARRASAAVVTVIHTSLPAALTASMTDRSGMPKVNETTGGGCSSTTASFACQSSSSWRGSPRSAPVLATSAAMARAYAATLAALSAWLAPDSWPGTNRLTPNGRAVSSLTRRHLAAKSAADR